MSSFYASEIDREIDITREREKERKRERERERESTLERRTLFIMFCFPRYTW